MRAVRSMRGRGFSLIELVIGSTLILIVSSVAMGVVLAVQQTLRDGQLRSAVTRDAQLTIETIGQDLQFAGAGVPRGKCSDRTLLGTLQLPADNEQLRPVVRVGDADYLAFVGDLPLPNAELNGVVALQNISDNAAYTPTNQHRMFVTSELSTCVPEVSPGGGPYECASHLNTLVDIAAVPADRCSETDANRRTCPWGLGKWQAPGRALALVVGAADGRWGSRAVDMSSSNEPDVRPIGEVTAVHLKHAVFGIIPEDVPSDYVSGSGAFMATLDRVFYTVERPDRSPCPPGTTGCVLRRRQCWGDVLTPSGDPGSDDWPRAGAPAIRSSADPFNCGAPNSGTTWEDLVDGIDFFAFRYYDDDPTTPLPTPLSAADAANVRVVEIELTVARTVPATGGKKLSQTMRKSFFIDNFGPLEDSGRL